MQILKGMLLASDLKGVAPAFVAPAGFDPLHDEGEAHLERLSGGRGECAVSSLRRSDPWIHHHGKGRPGRDHLDWRNAAALDWAFETAR
jgi:acetyl esterase